MDDKIVNWCLPDREILRKENYEPILLECINSVDHFRFVSGGHYMVATQESHCQCDAIGKNGYTIDFKLLICQESAENIVDSKLQIHEDCSGITSIGPSKAAIRGDGSLPYYSIWSLLRTKHLIINPHGGVTCSIDHRFSLKKTWFSLEKLLCTKKNILIFCPEPLSTESSCTDSVAVILERAKLVLEPLTNFRLSQAADYETYYALLLETEILLVTHDFKYIACILLHTLEEWRRLDSKCNKVPDC